MSAYSYREVLNTVVAQVQQLTPDEQLQLLKDLVESVVRNQTLAKPQHSILELEGLGKEIWEGVDVEKYIEEERASWDG